MAARRASAIVSSIRASSASADSTARSAAGRAFSIACEAVDAFQPLGGRGASRFGDIAVPAPQHARQRHQPLADRERLATIALGNQHLRQPPGERRRRLRHGGPSETVPEAAPGSPGCGSAPAQ
jgi:hypothetical protein